MLINLKLIITSGSPPQNETTTTAMNNRNNKNPHKKINTKNVIKNLIIMSRNFSFNKLHFDRTIYIYQNKISIKKYKIRQSTRQVNVYRSGYSI